MEVLTKKSQSILWPPLFCSYILLKYNPSLESLLRKGVISWLLVFWLITKFSKDSIWRKITFLPFAIDLKSLSGKFSLFSFSHLRINSRSVELSLILLLKYSLIRKIFLLFFYHKQQQILLLVTLNNSVILFVLFYVQSSKIPLNSPKCIQI